MIAAIPPAYHASVQDTYRNVIVSATTQAHALPGGIVVTIYGPEGRVRFSESITSRASVEAGDTGAAAIVPWRLIGLKRCHATITFSSYGSKTFWNIVRPK